MTSQHAPARPLSGRAGDPIAFEVLGVPAPQGSKTRMPNGAIVEGRSAGQREKHRNWRSAVADTARDVAPPDGPLDGPLHVTIKFRTSMPASRKKADREHGSAWKTTAPDLDKIVRATFDGLQAGGLVADDARICELVASKVETTGWTGASIFIERIEFLP